MMVNKLYNPLLYETGLATLSCKKVPRGLYSTGTIQILPRTRARAHGRDTRTRYAQYVYVDYLTSFRFQKQYYN